jgi:hypothetical protein
MTGDHEHVALLTDRQTDRQTNRQTDRQTDRQRVVSGLLRAYITARMRNADLLEKYS